MKRFNFMTIAVFSLLIFIKCSIYSTTTTNKWLEYELRPSKLLFNGNVFFEGKLSDGTPFYVYHDKLTEVDARFYHSTLWQDFGWKLKDSKNWTAPQSARETKLGYIYINPSREAAVYYYPDGNYSAFKVRFTEKD